ncbi:DUF461 domain-containing protein [Streptomyces sp. LP05-1]|uniref:DUF461 domain-containing protein n=1 Tax=Streptomyces pyxinae TaxID=2970734 RepID=A0ABT2CQE6_9ACTN|nr:DUF461 domain-containing protein [Streptomyces sp. LP05-1]MCS0638764.1 DUF461 domain-containing protein [Streptomyces sp. LP05-1]
MSRSLRRGTIAATAIVISIASLSACGAGNDAQTLQIRPDNAATTVGHIKIQNATVITQGQPGTEGPAVVSARLFNDGAKDQTLEGVELPGADAPVKLSPAQGSGPVTVPAHGSLMLGGENNPSAVIENPNEAAVNGDVREVVFKLSETGDVKLQAFVVPASGYYQDFGPTGAPSAPASGAASGKPSAPASAGTEGTGTAGTTGGTTGKPSAAASASHSAGH